MRWPNGDSAPLSPLIFVVTASLGRASNRTISVLVPAISATPVTCHVHGELCLYEGDLVLGKLARNGQLEISGLLGQEQEHFASSERRLSIIKGYSAFYWPNSIVSATVLSTSELRTHLSVF